MPAASVRTTPWPGPGGGRRGAAGARDHEVAVLAGLELCPAHLQSGRDAAAEGGRLDLGRQPEAVEIAEAIPERDSFCRRVQLYFGGKNHRGQLLEEPQALGDQ